MKKIFLLLAVIAFFGCTDLYETQPENPDANAATRAETGSPEHYYWCDGVKIPLTINENKMFVLVETAKLENVKLVAQKLGGSIESIQEEYDYAPLAVEAFTKSARPQVALTSLTLDNARLAMIDREDVVYVAPYFKTIDGIDIGITDTFEVRVEGDQDLAKLEKLAVAYNLVILGQNRFDRSIYSLACTKASAGNALEMSNLLYESGAFKYAAPDFLVESRADYLNEPYFGSQWNLQNNSYQGMDIGYVDAMATSPFPGISDIIVAVVDNGIESGHPDLPLYHISYNAHTGRSPSVIYGNHGTACAGIIGATANNGTGIAGIASGVKIMPISICYTKDGQRLGIPASTSSHFANAIRFAANNGADVISNSWSFGTNSPIPIINFAIAYAQGTNGRNGKGCVVVFSSGNDEVYYQGLPVSQPAAGAPAATLVVGAIERTGARALFSNYGNPLDVVAPGVSIPTTDLQGAAGYNKSGDYTTTFGGTSAACPHVAGIAALILSLRPDLTDVQVADMIEQSAKKVGNYTYATQSGRSNGLWNNQMGYGLVDAFEAVLLVLNGNIDADLVLSGPALPINIGGTYRITASYAGLSGGPLPACDFKVTESVFGNKATLRVIDGNICDVTFTKPGAYTITATLASDPSRQAQLPLSVYSVEVELEREQTVPPEPIYANKYQTFTARYYTQAHPDPQFSFTVTGPNNSPNDYEIGNVEDGSCGITFKKWGQYTVRAEVVGAPSIYKEQTVDVLAPTLAADFAHIVDGQPWYIVWPGQRIDFSVSGWPREAIDIELIDVVTGLEIPVMEDEDGPMQYYFDVLPERTDSKVHPAAFMLSLSAIDDPSIGTMQAFNVLPPSCYFKLEPLDILTQVAADGTIQEETMHAMWFYADRECTERIAAPCDFRIHVMLRSDPWSPVNPFPNRHCVEDEWSSIAVGDMEAFPNQLFTYRETNPAGEVVMQTYYEIHVNNFPGQATPNYYPAMLPDRFF